MDTLTNKTVTTHMREPLKVASIILAPSNWELDYLHLCPCIVPCWVQWDTQPSVCLCIGYSNDLRKDMFLPHLHSRTSSPPPTPPPTGTRNTTLQVWLSTSHLGRRHRASQHSGCTSLELELSSLLDDAFHVSGAL